MSFSEFTRTRLFAPLGMPHTSWRDDYSRVVHNRALAYSEAADGWHLNMPFENTYGNGGLLTTVGDLLRWNANLDAPRPGDAALTEELQRPGRLTSGDPHGYGLGLSIGSYKRLRELGHEGSTAGYTADLIRFPDQHLSVAVLCNAAPATAFSYAHAVADLYLGHAVVVRDPPKASHTMTASEIAAIQGMYRNLASDALMRLAGTRSGVQVEGGPTFAAMSSTIFVSSDDTRIEMVAPGLIRLTTSFGTADDFQRVIFVPPALSALRDLEGTYVSDEAETTVSVAIDGESLVLRRRPNTALKLTPLYEDAFSVPMLGKVVFRRDPAGKPVEFSVVQDRVWDLRFRRRE